MGWGLEEERGRRTGEKDTLSSGCWEVCGGWSPEEGAILSVQGVRGWDLEEGGQEKGILPVQSKGGREGGILWGAVLFIPSVLVLVLSI